MTIEAAHEPRRRLGRDRDRDRRAARTSAAVILATATVLAAAAVGVVARGVAEWGGSFGGTAATDAATWVLLALPGVVVAWVAGLLVVELSLARDEGSPRVVGALAGIVGVLVGLLAAPLGVVLTDLAT